MSNYGALVRKDSMPQEGMDLFVKCNVIFQKIGWTLEKWQDSVRNIRPSFLRREVTSAEICLREAEQRIWQLFLRHMNPTGNTYDGEMVCGNPSKASSDLHHCSPRGHNQYGAINQPTTINEHNVHVQKHTSTTEICNGVQTVITSTKNAQEKHMENLLLDWFITLDEKDKVRLEGMLLNEGHWKTSPITVRVGPTTLKTSSGTVYNIDGPMINPEAEDIPNFIQKKFHNGFPSDWEDAVQQWCEYVANQKRLVILENTKLLAKSPPSPVMKRSQAMAVSNNIQMGPNDHDVMPPPEQRKENSIRHRAIERIMSHTVTEQKVALGVKGMEEEWTSGSPKQRFSKRALNKTLEELSMGDGILNKTQDISADILLIKRWSVEVDGETGHLVLLGQLVTDRGRILDREFVSDGIKRRVRCDIIESHDGEIYRLLGPSVLTNSRTLEHGFPVNWKELLKRGNFPLRPVVRGNQASTKRNASNTDVTNETKMNHTTRSSIANTCGPKSKSLMIQQLIRQQINQGQTSMSDSRTNQSKDKNTSLQVKRKLEMAAQLPSNVVPLKKKRSDADTTKNIEGITTRTRDRVNSSTMPV